MYSVPSPYVTNISVAQQAFLWLEPFKQCFQEAAHTKTLALHPHVQLHRPPTSLHWFWDSLGFLKDNMLNRQKKWLMRITVYPWTLGPQNKDWIQQTDHLWTLDILPPLGPWWSNAPPPSWTRCWASRAWSNTRSASNHHQEVHQANDQWCLGTVHQFQAKDEGTLARNLPS